MSSVFDFFPDDTDASGPDEILKLEDGGVPGAESGNIEASEGVFSVPAEVRRPKGAGLAENAFDDDYENWNVPTRAVEENDTAFVEFAAVKDSMEPVSGHNGMYKRILEVRSDGDCPKHDWLVCIHYQLYQPGVVDPVDSSYAHDRPLLFRVGRGVVLRGLDLAVRTMRCGEVADFYLEPYLAYNLGGDNSRVISRIRKDHPVRIMIQLVDVIGNPTARKLASLSHEEMKRVDFVIALTAALEVKEVGNKLLSHSGKAEEAQRRYRMAITWLRNRNEERDQVEEREKRKLLAVLYTNLSKAYADAPPHCGPSSQFSLSAAKHAMEHARYAEEPSLLTKAHYRGARAAHALKLYEEAKTLIEQALRLQPADGSLLNLRERILSSLQEAKAEEVSLCKSMFKGFRPDDDSDAVCDRTAADGQSTARFAQIDEDVRLHLARRLLRYARMSGVGDYDIPEVHDGPVVEQFYEHIAQKLGLTPVHWATGELVAFRKRPGYELPTKVGVAALAAV